MIEDLGYHDAGALVAAVPRHDHGQKIDDAAEVVASIRGQLAPLEDEAVLGFVAGDSGLQDQRLLAGPDV